VYAALYEDGRQIMEPLVAPPASLLESIDGDRTVFIGDGAAAYREIIMSTLGGRAQFSDPLVPLLAGTIAQLAAPRLRAGDRPSPDAIRPLYVRRPDAEIARDARRS
jgi:tRNA threonylcarbamoyladenosine biosynthesis protein TsaB